MTEQEGVWLLSLTPDEAEALLEGETISFEFDGAVIEQDPKFHIEVEP